MLQHLIIRIPFYYLSSGRLREVKNKRKFQTFSLKVVVVAYERWSHTRSSKYGDLIWNILVSWKTGCRGEVVAYESWSKPEVRVYLSSKNLSVFLGFYPRLRKR